MTHLVDNWHLFAFCEISTRCKYFAKFQFTIQALSRYVLYLPSNLRFFFPPVQTHFYKSSHCSLKYHVSMTTLQLYQRQFLCNLSCKYKNTNKRFNRNNKPVVSGPPRSQIANEILTIFVLVNIADVVLLFDLSLFFVQNSDGNYLTLFK